MAGCKSSPKTSQVPCCSLISKQTRGDSLRMVGFGNTDQWRQVNEGGRRTGSPRASGIPRSRRMGAASADVMRAAVTEHVSEMKMTVEGRNWIHGNFTVASELRIFKQQVWCACLKAYLHITVNDTVIFVCAPLLKMYLFIYFYILEQPSVASRG